MSKLPTSLEEVVSSKLCAGCGLCQAISDRNNVRMVISEDGFFRPVIRRELPEEWREVAKVCPGIRVIQPRNQQAKNEEKMWGPVLTSSLAHATEPRVRWRASSGGALSALLIYLLESRRVRSVIHVGADGGEPLIPVTRVSRTAEEVVDNSGSRYAPSAPLANLPSLVDAEGGPVAFVGKPCDVAGLRAYLRDHPRLEERVAVIISFFCAGVPSLHATYELLSELGVPPREVTHIRYRGNGWPGRATAVTRERTASMSYHDSWGRILNRRLQFRCKICPDGIGELADVVFGDGWESEDGYPNFDERPGQSLMLARTPLGKELVEAAETEGFLQSIPYPLGRLEAIQPYQRNRRQAIFPRLLALRLLGRPTPEYRGFYLRENALRRGLPHLLRQLFGMLRRAYRG